MTLLDEFLIAPEDPEMFAKLATSSPTERKQAMKVVEERISSVREGVKELKHEHELRDLPDDDPEKIRLVAAWASFSSEMKTLMLAQIAGHWRNAKLKMSLALSWKDLQKTPMRELFEMEAPRWFPKTFAAVNREFGLYFEQQLDTWEWITPMIERGVFQLSDMGSDYFDVWPRFLRRLLDGSAEKLLDCFRQNQNYLENSALNWIRTQTEQNLAFREIPEFQFEDGTSANFARLLFQACTPLQRETILRVTLEAILDAKTEYLGRSGILVWGALGANAEEKSRVTSSLASLIASPHAAVVRFASSEITQLAVSAGADPTIAIPHLSAGLLQPSKPTRRVVMKLAEVVCAHSPERTDAIRAVLPAAVDPQPDIRKAFERLCARLNLRQKSEVASWLDECSAKIPGETREKLETILGRKFGQSPGRSGKEDCANPVVTERLRVQLVLPQTCEELAQLAAQLLTREPDPMDLELLLDGLAGFAAGRGDELSRLFTPLVKQAHHFRKGDGGSAGQYSLVSMLTGELVLCLSPEGPPLPWWIKWLEGKCDEENGSRSHYHTDLTGVFSFVQARLMEVVAAAHEGKSIPLLATPEFDDGTISADTLVRRFTNFRNISGWPHRHDIVQAIARTNWSQPATTDGLDESEAGRVLRFLLTGERQGEMTMASWWLTAARTRHPLANFSEDPDFQKWDESDLPDWTRPAHYTSKPQNGRIWSNYQQSGLLESEFRKDVSSDWLYVLAHQNGFQRRGYGNWCADHRWCYAMTPLHPDGKILLDIRALSHIGGAVSKQCEMDRICAADELSRRAPALSYPLRLAFLRGLGSTKPIYRTTAVDLIQGAVHDGRLASSAAEFVILFNRMLSCEPDGGFDGGANAKYLAAGLRELAGRDGACRKFTRDLLNDGLREKPPEIPAGLSALLELVSELLSEDPPETPLDLTTEWGGLPESKSEKLARRIAALKRDACR